MANEVVNNFPEPVDAGRAEKYVDFAWVGVIAFWNREKNKIAPGALCHGSDF
jgi:hypothetical protein